MNSKAIGRSLNRYIEKGRFIPPQIIKQYGDTPTQNFNTIINIGGLVDGYSHYSNDVSRDDKPKLIEISDNVRQFDERGYSVSKFGQGTGTAQKTESIAEDNSKNQYSIPTEVDELLDRYEILKNREITLSQPNAAEHSKILKNNPALLDKRLKTKEAEKILKKSEKNLEFSPNIKIMMWNLNLNLEKIILMKVIKSKRKTLKCLQKCFLVLMVLLTQS